MTSANALRGVADLIDKSLLLRAETSSERGLATRCSKRFARTPCSRFASGERDAALEGLAAYCAR